jgi:hypothetical protein
MTTGFLFLKPKHMSKLSNSPIGPEAIVQQQLDAWFLTGPKSLNGP